MSPKKCVTDEDRAEIITAYTPGRKLQEMVDATGWSTATICRVLDAAGLPRLPVGNRSLRRPDLDREAMVREYKEHGGLLRVSRDHGCTPSTTKLILKKAGVKR